MLYINDNAGNYRRDDNAPTLSRDREEARMMHGGPAQIETCTKLNWYRNWLAIGIIIGHLELSQRKLR